MLIPPGPAWGGICENSSVASLLWSVMEQACDTISEMLHTSFSIPSMPGLTAFCWISGARLTMAPPEPTPSSETLAPLMTTVPVSPDSVPHLSTLPMTISGAESTMRLSSRMILPPSMRSKISFLICCTSAFCWCISSTPWSTHCWNFSSTSFHSSNIYAILLSVLLFQNFL